MGKILPVLLIFSLALSASGEQITVTTYYPAPSGIYNQMVTTAQTLLARDGGDVGVGLGATAPGAKLDILSDVTRTPLQVKGGGNAGVEIARFYNGGGTEVMRIDNTGRVGIGTNAPASLLDVAGTSRVTNLQVTNVATAGAACTPNGLIAQDNTGGILSCKSSVWTAASGGGGGTWTETWTDISPGCNGVAKPLSFASVPAGAKSVEVNITSSCTALFSSCIISVTMNGHVRCAGTGAVGTGTTYCITDLILNRSAAHTVTCGAGTTGTFTITGYSQ